MPAYRHSQRAETEGECQEVTGLSRLQLPESCHSLSDKSFPLVAAFLADAKKRFLEDEKPYGREESLSVCTA